MREIPKIIHQTWRDENVPEHFKILIKTWTDMHPEWEYRLWTDEMNRSFIEKYSPEFLTIYDDYPYNIQRVDAVRYLILKEIGGVFIDLDFECLKNIEPLLEGQLCVFGLEPEDHCKRFKKRMIICNAFMACSAGNDFFKTICDNLRSQDPKPESGTPSWITVLESTGPFSLTAIFSDYHKKKNVKLLPSGILYPLTLNETGGLLSDSLEIDEVIQSKIDKAFAVHYFFGTWHV